MVTNTMKFHAFFLKRSQLSNIFNRNQIYQNNLWKYIYDSFDNKERRKMSCYVIEISNTVFGNQNTCHLVITLSIINTTISAAEYLICNGR